MQMTRQPGRLSRSPSGLDQQIATGIARLRARWRSHGTSDAAIGASVTCLVIWTCAGNYVGIFGLAGLSSPDLATPFQLVGIALACLLQLGIVLAFFSAPRWQMPGIEQPEKRLIAWLRPGIVALAIALCPWIDPLPLIMAGTLALIAANASIWSTAPGRDRSTPACLYLFLQIPVALLAMFWLMVWVDMWMRAANFWLGEMSQAGQIGLLWSSSAAGWLLYMTARAADWRGIGGALLLALTGLGLSNPGFPAIMAGALYVFNAGGGRVDIEASADGPLLCDLGAFGRHFYVKAGREGCTYKSATRWIRAVRAYDGTERTRFLRAERVVVRPGQSL